MRLRRIWSRTLAGSVVVAALVGALTLGTLPPRARPSVGAPLDPAISLDGTPRTPVHTASGVLHVHSTRSDGTGTVDEIAAAAARANVQFVIFTDHGDGTRMPLPPQYRSGVLCLDAVEISTEGGHYVALDLPRTPYRLAGESRDVVEDVHRLGGFGVAAHPDSPKAELAWQGWDRPFDGLEWFNLDSEWRDERNVRLLLALLHYPLRPAPALGALVRADRPLLARWDRLARDRRIVAVAAVDAHARAGADAGRGGGLHLRVPSYETSFNTARIAVELPSRLSGQADADARAILDAIRDGRTYSWLEAFASAGRVELSAERTGGTRVPIGGFAGGPLDGVRIRAASTAPAGSEIRVICDGAVAASGPTPGPVVHQPASPSPSSCRAEVGWIAGGTFLRWLVTNPIYGRAHDAARADPWMDRIKSDKVGYTDRSEPRIDQKAAPVAAEPPMMLPGDLAWVVEHDASSAGEVETSKAGDARTVSLRYQLGPGNRSGRYCALVAATPALPSDTAALHVTLSADRPMRVSVQLREPDGSADGVRWRRSVYVDPFPRTVRIALDDVRPIEPGQPSRPSIDRVHAILFVVDTMNTTPGERGTFTVQGLSVLR